MDPTLLDRALELLARDQGAALSLDQLATRLRSHPDVLEAALAGDDRVVLHELSALPGVTPLTDGDPTRYRAALEAAGLAPRKLVILVGPRGAGGNEPILSLLRCALGRLASDPRSQGPGEARGEAVASAMAVAEALRAAGYGDR